MIPLEIDSEHYIKIIQQNFNEKEISEIDFRAMGNLILNQTRTLSHKVNNELLEPISHWLDDPDWFERFKIYEDGTPNWAEYKRRQREWTQQQKLLATERLKLYWQEIRRRRDLRKELSKVLHERRFSIDNEEHQKSIDKLNQDFLSLIITPFSAKEQHKAETKREFIQALDLSVSNLLPWKLLLESDLVGVERKIFGDLKTYFQENKKIDKTSKLIHLLQMESEGTIILDQNKPFGVIKIKPLSIINDQSITIKDQQGKIYEFNWRSLSDYQRSKIIADIKSNKILYKAVQAK